MTRLVILTLGTLSGALLELAARRARFDEIVVASSHLDKAQAKANNARIGAALDGAFPRIEAAQFDMYAADAPSRLRDLGADVIFSAPSMMPWWRLRELSVGQREWLGNAPFATFMACHLAPMLQLRDVVDRAAIDAHWVGASSPDVVNAVLAGTGNAPICGTGNVAEVIPKIALGLRDRLGANPAEFDIKLVAQHAFEYYCFGAGGVGAPPYLLHATHHGEDVTPVAQADLFSAYPFPYELDFNLVTVGATNPVLEALVADTPRAAHVPAPGGRVGGYPVRVSHHGIELDLPGHWSEQQAIDVNNASLAYDGIEGIDADGTLHFTAKSAAAIEELSGQATRRLAPGDARAQAERLVRALG